MVDTQNLQISELSEHRVIVRTPIAKNNPIGERIIDDPLFDFVESQMMKVGSLSHAEVRWDEVETSILSLMKNKTKDLKLLVHLLQCLQQSNSVERFLLSLQVLTDFMEVYWENCFPAPGNRGVLPRKKFFTQIVQRSEKALDKLVQGQTVVSDTVQEELELAKSSFSTTSESLGLSGDNSIALVNGIERWLTSCRQSKQTNQAQKKDANNVSDKSGGASASEVRVSIDTSSLKSTKESMQKMADYLSESESGFVLSIRLRRYSVWLSITTPPDSNALGETSLRSMPQDRVREYLELIDNQPNLALWRKLEQSLLNAPFWFEGQYLSAQLAMKLGQQTWANAILDETRQFLERLPELSSMSFKDGLPFVNDDTRQWLLAENAEANNSIIGSWDDKRDEALRLSKEAGLSVAMAMLNDGLAQSIEPREQFYWRLVSADLLANHGLEAIAYQHYQSLYQIVTQSTVKDWEPTLIQKLEKIVITE